MFLSFLMILICQSVSSESLISNFLQSVHTPISLLHWKYERYSQGSLNVCWNFSFLSENLIKFAFFNILLIIRFTNPTSFFRILKSQVWRVWAWGLGVSFRFTRSMCRDSPINFKPNHFQHGSVSYYGHRTEITLLIIPFYCRIISRIAICKIDCVTFQPFNGIQSISFIFIYQYL